jgi:hypothetical protein
MEKFNLTIACTPSDWRDVKNVAKSIRRELARCGIEQTVKLNPMFMMSVEREEAEDRLFELITLAEKQPKRLLEEDTRKKP